MDEYLIETWDPEGSDFNRTTYSYNPNKGTISADPNGNIILYNADPRTHNLEEGASHIYWDKKQGTTYYIDPTTKQAVEITVPKLRNLTAPGLYNKLIRSYLGDSTLDQVAEYVNGVITANNAKKLQEEQERDAFHAKKQAEAAGGNNRVDHIAVTPSADETTAASEKIASDAKYADMRLQTLIDTEEANQEASTSTPAEETVYYNYGPEEIDLKYYLHNLGTNLQNYLNSQNWSNAQKNAFKKAYETYKAGLTEQLTNKSGRFKTDDAGILIDSQGLLDGKNDHVFIDELGNTYNSLDEITDKKLRNSAVEFSPNDEVANYFNTIGQAVVGAGKTRKGNSTANGAFDLNNNGFVHYWADKINPAGGEVDMAPYWQLDSVGADGKRGRTNRTKYLAYQLNQYIKAINKGNYNFEGTSFKTKENFISKIRQAITNLNNGWDDSDPASLQAIGVTADFYNALMSDKADPLASAEDEAAAKTEEAAKKRAEAESSYIEKTKTKYDEYAGDSKHYTGNNKLAFVPDTRYEVPKDKGSEQAYKEALGDAFRKFGFSISGIPGDTAYNSAVGTAIDVTWKKVKQALYNGATAITVNNKVTKLSEVLPVIMPWVLNTDEFQESTDKDGNPILLGKDSDGQYGTVLCFQDNKLFYDWWHNHKGSATWNSIQTNFENKYNEQTTQPSDKPKYSFSAKQGGVIKKYAEGGAAETAGTTETAVPGADASEDEIAAYMASLQQAPTEETPTTTSTATHYDFSSGKAFMDSLYASDHEKANARGMSYARYYAKQRQPLGAKTSLQPENGIFKPEDYARMGAIMADLTSLVLDPVSGAAVGVGATASNFVADWLDNTVTTSEMWKNLGMNLGMDALGIIPIVGDAAGTGGKLLKSIKTIAPKLMYGLTAYGALGTLKNAPDIMESLKKVTSDEKLTVGDYQNIAQAITAVAGLNSGFRSHVAKKMAKKDAKVDDAIGIGLRKQGSDSKQDYIFRGEKAKKIKQLVSENKTEDLNKYIQGLEGFSNFEVNTNLKSIPIGSQFPIGRTVGENGEKHWGVRSPLSIERKIDAFEIFDPKKIRGTSYATKNLLNTRRQNAVSEEFQFSDADLMSKADLNELAKEQIKNSEKGQRAIQASENRRKRVSDLEAELNGTKDKDGNVDKKGAKTLLEEAKQASDAAKAEVDAKQKALETLNTKKYEGLDLNDPENRALAIDDIEEKLKAKRNERDRYEVDSKSSEKAKKDEADKQLKILNTEIKNLEDDQNLIKNWDKEKKSLVDALNSSTRNAAPKIETQNNLDTRVKSLEKQLSFLKNPDRRSRRVQALYDLLGDGPFNVSLEGGKTREVDNETVQKILKDLNLFKKGGNIIQRAVKAAHGVQLKAPANSWYGQVFSNYKDEILNRIAANRDYYKTINDMQTAHHSLYMDAGGANGGWDKTAYQGKNNSVGNYQEKYDKEDFNKLGISPHFEARYGYQPHTKRTSGDNNKEKYKYDNLYSSITDDRRVLGRLGDWDDTQFRDFNNALKDKNLEMYLGDGDYYYIRELGSGNPQQPNPTTPSTGPALDMNELDLTEGRAGGYPDDPNNKKEGNGSKFNWEALTKNLPDPMAYLRYKILDNNNRAIARHAMANEKPFLQDPQLDYVKVRSDLRAEMEGARQQAELERRAYNTVSTDTSKQMNFQKELWLEGLKYKQAGLKQSDDTYRATAEKSKQQDIANHTAEHNVAMQNRLAMHQSNSNRAKIWNAYLTKRANAFDTLLSKYEYDREVAKKKREANTESAKLAEMQAAVVNNPNNYGANLTPAELKAYNQGRGGVSYNSMAETDKPLYLSALEKVQAVARREGYKIKGVPETEYTYDAMNNPSRTAAFTASMSDPNGSSSSSTSSTTLGQIAKNGAKLDLTRLRKFAKNGSNIEEVKIKENNKTRIKNADRLHKNIKEKVDSINKQLATISKSMYGVPKLKIVS